MTLSNDTTDRRVRRTRRLLGEALLALLVERPFHAITVQQITERADLNRATFYLHFTSKEDLLLAGLEERFDDLMASMPVSGPAEALWVDAGHDLLLFRHVAEHAALYRALLGDGGLGMIIHRILEYMRGRIEAELADDLPPGVQLDAPLPVVASFTSGALFALLKWWLDSGMPYSPEEMAGWSNRLCRGAVGGAWTPTSRA